MSSKKTVPRRRVRLTPVLSDFKVLPSVQVHSSRVRWLATDSEFRKLVKARPRLLLNAFRLIVSNEDVLRTGKRLESPDKSVSCHMDWTGKHKGFHARLLLRVNAAGRSFFVKWGTSDSLKRSVQATKQLEDFLAANNHELNGVRFRIIRPLLVYRAPDREFLVSNFYPATEVVQCLELKNRPLQGKINAALKSMRDGLANLDVDLTNAFFHPGSKTVLLYDVGYPEYPER